MNATGTPRVLTHRGSTVALGGRLFRKEVLRAGSWVHPQTKQEIAFTATDLEAIAAETNRWIAAQGGRIPFPDGHRFDAQANLGYWLAFSVEGDRLYGVVEAGDDAVAGKLGTTIRDVSAFIEGEATDSKGEAYREVVTHVAATPFPVLTGQQNFIELSRADASEAASLPVLRLASDQEEQLEMDAWQAMAGELGLAVEGLEGDALEQAVRARVKALADAEAEAKEAQEKATQALSAKASEAEQLSTRVAALERQLAEREQAECDREVSEVKALCARCGRPEAFGPSREKYVRERWSSDREAARQTLALARELAQAGGQVEGKAVKPTDKEAQEQAQADAFEAARRQARALGWKTREDGGQLLAFKPGAEREIVLVG